MALVGYCPIEVERTVHRNDYRCITSGRSAAPVLASASMPC